MCEFGAGLTVYLTNERTKNILERVAMTHFRLRICSKYNQYIYNLFRKVNIIKLTVISHEVKFN